jgi:hypothetical protein
MIMGLSETRKREAELRGYLVKAIGERIESVFGPSGCTDEPLEEITRIEPDPLRFTIWHVLGIDIQFMNEPPPLDFRLPTHPDIPDHITVEESTGETPGRLLELSPDEMSFHSIMEL